ncbi:MAG: ABC-2 family transporter protein [Polyangiaceae bacterium]
MSAGTLARRGGGELGRAIAAYPAMLRAGFAGAVAYRAEMVVWMLTTTMPLVSLALWSAVAEGGSVGRYSQRDFAVYFIAVLLVRQLTSSWLVWELNYEIKQGILAQKLLKPMHPLWSYSAANLGALPLRVVLCSPLVILSAALFDALPLPRQALSIFVFCVSLLGAWLINFFIMALVGSLAFFVESSIAVFDFYLLAFVLLSGYIVPLDLFPPAVREATYYLPFRYTVAFPVEVATETITGAEMRDQLAAQWGFVVVAACAALLVFRAGVRRFGAFGG